MADGSQLLVLVSILNALAVARLFEYICKYFYQRGRVRMEPLVPAWAVLTLLFIIRNWWGYANTTFEAISFWEYLGLLQPPVLVYLLAVLLTPELPEEGVLDLREHYFRVSRWLFLLVLLMFLPKQISRLLAGDHGMLELPNLIRLAFIALLATVGWTRRRAVHLVFCAVALLLYLSFVILVR